MEQGSATPERSSGEVWKDATLVRTYLDGVRAAIPLAGEQIGLMLRLVERSASPVERFADLGCGDGALSRAILTRYPEARATLVDFSQPMMEVARTRLGSNLRCRFVEADLSVAEWADGISEEAPFDVIVSGYAIHHLTDGRKRELYGEVLGLLRPGGLFVNTEHVKSPTAWLEGAFNELLIDSFFEHEQRRGSGMTREEVAAKYVNREDKHDNVLASAEEQCRWLRELGYEDVDCYFKLLELAIFGGRRPA